MVLKQMELFRFKQLLHAKVAFQPGLNIVRGPNESGKSTLRLALLTAFYGNPTSNSESLNELTTWGQNKRCECRLDFIDTSGMLCTLRKDFEAKTIFLLRGQESFRSWGTIRDLLNDWLGIPGEELYTLCASLDVRQLANLGSQASRKQVGKMLAGLMTGTAAGQDVLQVLKRLDESIRELVKGEGPAAVKNPGPLRQVKEQLQQLQVKKVQAEDKLKTRLQKLKQLEDMKPELEKSRERLAGLDHLINANLRWVEADKRKSELVLQDADFEKNQQFRGKLEKESADLSQRIQSSPLVQWSPAEIENLQQTIQKKAVLQKTDCAAPVTDLASRYLLGFGGVLSLLGLALLGWNAALAGLILACGLGASVAGFLQIRSESSRLRRHCEQQVAQTAEMEKLEQSLVQAQQRAQGLEIPALLAEWQELQQLQARKSVLDRQLVETPSPDPERWQGIRRELRLLEDEMKASGLLALKVSPLELASKQKEHGRLEELVNQQTSQQKQLETLVAYDANDSEEALACDEQISAARERFEYLNQRERICRLTYRFLDQARRDTLNPARQVLEQRAGELLAIFSHGKYQHIAVDDEDLSSKILLPVPGKPEGEWQSPDVLSQGAFDQFYLSLRLALAEIISQGRKPPLLLDEPLSAFDPERAQATLQQLKTISRERQVLFFTCRPDYDSAADHIIELPLPAE